VGQDLEGGSFYDGKTDFPVFFPASLDFRVWENQEPTFVFYTGLEGKWQMAGGRPLG